MLVDAKSPAFLAVVLAKRERGLALYPPSLISLPSQWRKKRCYWNGGKTHALRCFVLNAASFCVAGDWMVSDGET